MIVLIIGEPNSGKSQKAEELATRLSGDGKRVYIATMIPFGEEGAKRVAKHRKMREGKGFITIEKPTDIRDIADAGDVSFEDTCLLECMSNLVGNEMHSPGSSPLSDELLIEKIVGDVSYLADKCRDLIIVSNRFPLEDTGYDDDTKRYVELTRAINDAISGMADKTINITGNSTTCV